MKNVAILGSTGSVGVNALNVISAFPRHFKVAALSSFSNTKLLSRQIERFKPRMAASVGKKILKKGVKIFLDEKGLADIASDKDIDIVVIAVSGACAIKPLIAAIKAGKHICLANKESIVAAGDIIMKELKKSRACIIPVDSEHSAIFQCLNSSSRAALHKIFLTGSGGPLHSVKKERFASLRIKDVLNHPKWDMGRKITVDSATLMNKGLEVIEAHHLFGAPVSKIKVLIHPQAIIHSMCEFIDGSIIAQLGVTDMKLPIQYALTYPQRLKTPFPRIDFSKVNSLTFEEPDVNKYPCFSLALAAAKLGGVCPAALNAANEVAIEAFLKGKINFIRIADIIERVLLKAPSIESPALDDIFEIDKWAREKACNLC